MNFEHCGFCGFMSLTKMPVDGMKKCSRCDWEGYPERSSMENINKLAKSYRTGNKWAPPIKASRPDVQEIDNDVKSTGSDSGHSEPVQRSSEPRQQSFRMDDKEAYTSENRIGDRIVSNKVPKNQELLNRLKGKNFKGADFL